MKKIFLFVSVSLSCLYADLQEDNEKRCKELDKQIKEKKLELQYDMARTLIDAGDIPGFVVKGGKAFHDAKQLESLLREKLPLVKNEKEKAKILEELDRLESNNYNKNFLDGYLYDHADEGDHTSEPNKVGGLRQ